MPVRLKLVWTSSFQMLRYCHPRRQERSESFEACSGRFKNPNGCPSKRFLQEEPRNAEMEKAMENALAVIQREQKAGSLVFVNTENFQSDVDLYKTEATVIKARPDEFHNIQGKFMPSRPVTDRIGEAAGVQFIEKTCRVRTETKDDDIAGRRTVYIGSAQGKVRMPDGSWRESAVEEYEFDPKLRAMLDKKVDYITESNRSVFARTAMEYEKVARQRAATGARLRVIRQLVGVPVAFTAEDMKKPMVFTRVVQNTSRILDTPEGRTLATMQALGMTAESLYGKKLPQADEAPTETVQEEDLKPADTSGFEESAEDITPEPGVSAADLAAQANPAGNDEQKKFEELTVRLEELMAAHKDNLDHNLKNGMNPYKLAQAEIDDFGATIESREAMISRTVKFLENLGVTV